MVFGLSIFAIGVVLNGIDLGQDRSIEKRRSCEKSRAAIISPPNGWRFYADSARGDPDDPAKNGRG